MLVRNKLRLQLDTAHLQSGYRSDLQISVTEAQIDHLVYELYELTDEEINMWRGKMINEITKSHARFSINYKQQDYKIFSYFNAAKDGSFALHSYFEATHSAFKSFGEKFSDQIIDIKSVDKLKIVNFKDNFHRSGIVKMKNKVGEQNYPDIQSIKFNLIRSETLIFFIQPTIIDRYPRTDSDKEYIELTLGNVSLLPPLIQCFFCPKNCDFESNFINTHLEGNYFKDPNILKSYKLDVYIYVRRYKDGIYPSTPISGILVY